MATAAFALVGGGTFAVSSASAESTKPLQKTASESRAASVNIWAKVSRNGVLLGGQNISSVTRFGTGRYSLITTLGLGNCGLIGTLNGDQDADPGPGTSSVFVNRGGPNEIFVRTATPSAGSVDDNRAFSVMVVC
ncbi:hypothetical protein [Streptomyces sp. NPDC047315]|uniref:hypothetical protein n=1 Tax=Streptomyces sp. NPDC047315 TaxID=3155142 RepID=UPI0033F23B5E